MTWNGEWHTPDAGDFQGYVTLQFDTRDSAVPVPNYATHYVQPLVDLKPPYVRIFWLEDGETFTTRDLSIEGAGESYAQIILTATRAADNAAFTAETSCNGLGDWSATLSVDQDGIYTITAQAIDLVGNTGELSQPLTVIVDTTGPVITDVSVSDRFIQTGPQNIQASAVVVDSLSQVAEVKVLVKDELSEVTESTLTMKPNPNIADGYLTTLITEWLSEGHKNVLIQAKDKVGNLTESPESEGFTVDGTKPSVSGPILSLLSSAQNLYPDANTLYYGPASSGSFNVLIEASDQDPIIDTSGLEILLFPAIFNDPPRQLDAHGAMTQTVNVTYTVIAAHVANPSYSILVYDRSNNQNSVVLKLTHDETPPVIEQLLFSAANSTNTYLQTDTQTLYYGPASAGALVATALVTDSGSGVKGVFSPAIFGAGGEFDSAQPYSREYMINNSDVTEGFYDWTAEDRVGNKGNSGATQGITIVYDTESPVAAITLPNEAGMVFPITWSASDNLSGISTYDVQFKDGINGTWTFWQTAVSYTEGKFTGIAGHQVYFRARATDRVGNTGAWTEAKLITIAGQEPIKYYTFNGQRVALRKGSGSSAPVYYLHGDHLGSVSLTTDQAGQVVAETRSLPYGKERWSNGTAQTDFGFSGQRKDGFGLMDYNARFYSPLLGRFVSADNIVPLGRQGVQAWDRYAYTNNNPVNFKDPTGHIICDEDGSCYDHGLVRFQVERLDDACRRDVHCRTAYITYKQLVWQVGHKPSASEVLYMTAQAEGYSVVGQYRDEFIEGLARNYYQPYAACGWGSATCTDNKLYKFMSGYQPWWDSSKSSLERASYLSGKLEMDNSRASLESNIALILDSGEAERKGWAKGMEGEKPWQWHNWWRKPDEGEAIGWVFAPNRYGNYFWIMTANQTEHFIQEIKPKEIPD